MKKYTVAIKNENDEITTGTMNGEAQVGQEICIDIHDENGVPGTAFGVLSEVLEEIV